MDRLCRRFDSELGPRARRLMYVHMLPQKELLLRVNNTGVPRWEDRLMRLGWPVVVRYAKRHLGIEPGIEVEDEAVVWRELDFVADLLADGRPYLCGEHFGAADLTFASLSAAAIVPPVYGTPLPQPDVLRPPRPHWFGARASTLRAATPCGCSRPTAARWSGGLSPPRLSIERTV